MVEMEQIVTKNEIIKEVKNTVNDTRWINLLKKRTA